MGKYTVYNQKWIDETIDGHLKVMVEKIKRALSQVVSIFLVGGFGRGEGSVVLEKNEKVRPVNDYDIYLIAKKEVSEEIINNLAKEIEKELGSKGYSLYGHSRKEFYFDIRLITKDKLKKMLPLIKYYEFKHASALVYGDDLRDLIPDFKKEELIFSDGLRFLLNRISHITEWFSVNYLKNKPIEDWERETLIYDISKTYIEICTVLTLLKGYYQPTYRGRMDQLTRHQAEFEELWRKFPGLLERIRYFTKQKLEPNFQEIDDIKKIWFEARKDALGSLEFVLREKYQAASWRDFKKVVFKNYFKPYLSFKLGLPDFILVFLNPFVHKFLNLVWFFRLIKFKKIFYWRLLSGINDPGILIFYAALFIVQIVKEDGGLDKEVMSRGIKILKAIYPIKEISYDLDGYDRLRKNFSDAWRLYYFQKLI